MLELKLKLKQLFIFAYGILNAFLHRLHPINKADKKVLVMLNGAIGDTILFIHPLLEYIKYISKKGITNIDICCRSEIERMIKPLLSDDGIAIYTVDIGYKSYPSLNRFIELARIFSKPRYEVVIVTIHIPWVYALTACTRSRKYYGYFGYTKQYNKMRIITDLLFDDVIIGKPFEFVGSDYERLIQAAGFGNYRKKMYTIQNDKQKIKKDRYMVFAPMASDKRRSLSDDQITQIAAYLDSVYSGNILLCGSIEMAEEYKYIIDMLRADNIKSVINYAGKTCTLDYLNLVSNCDMVVGVDSGSIHIAAMYQVPCLALCGWWGGKFLPYQYETNETPKMYPECVYSNKVYNCMYCVDRNLLGSINDICNNMIKNMGQCLCLSEINMSDVKNQINKLMYYVN